MSLFEATVLDERDLRRCKRKVEDVKVAPHVVSIRRSSQRDHADF